MVDDEPDLTMLFKLGLEDNGFEVDAFNHPLIALNAFKERPSSYDLALIDIRMPEMNGFQLYNEMKKINNRVKVCFITAFDIQQTDMETIASSIKNLLILFESPSQLKKWWKK